MVSLFIGAIIAKKAQHTCGESEKMSKARIRVGSWYSTVDGESLKVVAFDRDEEVIEVQFYDGTIEEYDLDDWEELAAKPIAPPEDWAGSYDVGSDDYGVDLDRPAGDSHFNPFDHLEDKD
jgi:hypothetical protein